MTNPADFFLDPARMELALYVLTSWFAAGEHGAYDRCCLRDERCCLRYGTTSAGHRCAGVRR